ncbi:Protein-export protein [gamma proteobacterium HdN1]|nr:Protein-export protein [gamma proteobacterium HdN1]
MSDEQEEVQGQFQIQRVYTKDVSFESPNAPEIFRQEWKPEVNLEVNSGATQVEGDTFEVLMKVTVTVKNQDKTAFIAEVQQAGLFTVSGFEPLQMQHLLKGVAPNALFPYAREAITDLVTRGTFPQFLLQPINFEAAFIESLRRQQEEQQNGAAH